MENASASNRNARNAHETIQYRINENALRCIIPRSETEEHDDDEYSVRSDCNVTQNREYRTFGGKQVFYCVLVALVAQSKRWVVLRTETMGGLMGTICLHIFIWFSSGPSAIPSPAVKLNDMIWKRPRIVL